MRILIAIIIAILTAILGVGHPAEEVSVTPIEPVVKEETAVVEESGDLVEVAPETDPPLTERPQETSTVEFVVPTVEIPPEAGLVWKSISGFDSFLCRFVSPR